MVILSDPQCLGLSVRHCWVQVVAGCREVGDSDEGSRRYVVQSMDWNLCRTCTSLGLLRCLSSASEIY